MGTTLCHCGQPLHYTDKELEKQMQELVDALGPNIEVTVQYAGGRRRFIVPRHYIALHGIKGKDISTLGFKEV